MHFWFGERLRACGYGKLLCNFSVTFFRVISFENFECKINLNTYLDKTNTEPIEIFSFRANSSTNTRICSQLPVKWSLVATHLLFSISFWTLKLYSTHVFISSLFRIDFLHCDWHHFFSFFSFSDLIFHKRSNLVKNVVEANNNNFKVNSSKKIPSSLTGTDNGSNLLKKLISTAANGLEEVEELFFKTHGASFNTFLSEINN